MESGLEDSRPTNPSGPLQVRAGGQNTGDFYQLNGVISRYSYKLDQNYISASFAICTQFAPGAWLKEKWMYHGTVKLYEKNNFARRQQNKNKVRSVFFHVKDGGHVPTGGIEPWEMDPPKQGLSPEAQP